jgi:hypothetical protein
VVRHCRAQEHAARRIDPPTVGYSERVEVITANGHSLQALMYSIDAGRRRMAPTARITTIRQVNHIDAGHHGAGPGARSTHPAPLGRLIFLVFFVQQNPLDLC